MIKRYFISDAHFGSGFGNEAQRVELFTQFSNTISGTNSELYILGDFFDFWIEYRQAVRTEYVKVLASFYNLTRSGVKISIVRGNHDFMDYSYFSREFGVTILDGHNSLEFNGLKVRLCHGDDLRGDWKYRALHAILRNRFAQRCYTLIHPEIGVGLATSLSHLSRKHSSKTGRYLSDERQAWYHNCVDGILGKSEDEILLMGHTHRADLSQLSNGIYGNCGTWLNAPTVIVLEDRTLRYCEFTPEGESKFSLVKEIEVPQK